MKKIISKDFRIVCEPHNGFMTGSFSFAVSLEHRVSKGCYETLSQEYVMGCDNAKEAINYGYDKVVLKGLAKLCDNDENVVLDTLRANNFYEMTNGDLQGLVESYFGC